MSLTYTVTPADAGKTVGQLLRQRLGLSAAMVRSLKRIPEGILLEGDPVFTNVKPEPGQVITARSELGRVSEGIAPEPGELDIVYEDGDLLILNKPAGIPVHPTKVYQGGTLANRVMYRMEQRGTPGVFHAINRLDKGTSGLVLVAKHKAAAFHLEGLLDKGLIHRHYMAVLEHGDTLPDSGTVDLPLGRKDGHGIRRAVCPDGQPAVTHFTVRKRQKGYALVELRLETGRTHQIRAHMSHLGCPVANDFMYGTEVPGEEGHALHAFRLEIGGDKPLTVTCPVPERFSHYMDMDLEEL